MMRIARVCLGLAACMAGAACGGSSGGATPSSNADLAALTISTGTLSPAFAPTVTAYTVGPGPLDAQVSVTPTAAAAGATITVDGVPVDSGVASQTIPLPEGTTTVNVVVTAPDGVTLRTTTIQLTRTVPSSNADLASLQVSTGALTPAFSPSVTAYTVGPGLLDGQVVVVPTAADAGATITVDGQPVTSGSPASPRTLPYGTTPVNVVVTAEDGVTTVSTSIQLTRGGLQAQEAYIKASNAEADDNFGYDVAISGDTLVATAWAEASNASGVDGDQNDNSLVESGAAYVFVRDGATWTQQAYLKASNPEFEDGFGRSVDISGDTIVVGAWREDGGSAGVNGNESDNSVASSGAAYVFVRSGTTWTQQAYLKASNPGVTDQFGEALAIDGDTIVIGAAREDSNATGVDGDDTDESAGNSGAAYVFVRSGTTWTQQAYLKASNTGAGDEFGLSVSVSGDTIVVGAPFEDSGATGVDGNEVDDGTPESGAAYVFVRNGTTWTQQAYLKASNTDADDLFGWSAAVSGDTVAIGAQEERSNATGVGGDETDDSLLGAGAAYVFVRTGTSWSQQAYVKASNTDLGDNFGFSIAVDGDRLLVGAFNEDSPATGLDGDETINSLATAGAAYVFGRVGTTWSQLNYVKASNTGTLDRFSYHFDLGDATVVVGSYLEDSDGVGVGGNEANDLAADSGAVYVLR